MQKRPHYGQYCPLSMAAEILGTRWTLLLLRELLEGSVQFNDIARGVPLISRSMLSQRLKELEAVGLITREAQGPGKPTHYRLTEAGQSLGPIVRSVAEWGQEWIDTKPSLEDVDTDFLMWDVRRNLRLPESLSSPFVLHFHFPDGPDGKTNHWLVYENGKIDICYIDPGHDVDVSIEAGVKDFTSVWMGWLSITQAQEEGRLFVDGPPSLTRDVPEWLGLSSVSAIAKRPPEQRVLRTV
ncbi:MAG: helix-turn-helix domain-containing protein [Hoeflea sp.]|uniref:winged helix-turn-helix transcriptional regulator n=1 Tax=Hoeflea sp. TaxID=1940281 RepID=UPI0032EBD3A4